MDRSDTSATKQWILVDRGSVALIRMKPFSLLILTLTAVSQIRGHGGIYNYTIDGVDYPG